MGQLVVFWINHFSLRGFPGTGSRNCGFNPFRGHEVGYATSVEQKVIADNAPVASPPDGLRTHYRYTLVTAKLHEFVEATGKAIAKGIV